MKLSVIQNKMEEILNKHHLTIELPKSPQKMQEFSSLIDSQDEIVKDLNLFSGNFYQELEMDSPYINTHFDSGLLAGNVQLHSHSFYEILYCTDGTVQYLVSDRRYHIQKGDIVFIHPGVSHCPIFYDDMKMKYSRIVLWVSNLYIKTLTDQWNLAEISSDLLSTAFLLRTDGTRLADLGRYFTRGLYETDKKEPFWATILYANTGALLSELFRATTLYKDNLPTARKDSLDPIISFIEYHFKEKLSLEAVAKEFHISISTLGKLFKDRLNTGFYHFITQRRLIYAKKQIELGSAMEEIAVTCGFSDYSSFYRAFKKEYGISPREYKTLIENQGDGSAG